MEGFILGFVVGIVISLILIRKDGKREVKENSCGKEWRLKTSDELLNEWKEP